MKKGIFIVIDGIDGTGKATQTELLVKRLRALGRAVEKIDFPGYERNVFGKLIGECLAGKHGDFLHLDSKIASALYAADRFESKAMIEKWIAKGKTVIADRFVSSNQMHQGGKIKNKKEKLEFLKWLDHMEYGIFGLPRPDLIIYLSLPVAVSVRLLSNKSAAEKKKYLQGRKDMVENDIRYLENSRKSALEIIKGSNHWVKIDCESEGDIKARDEIHELVFKEASALLVRRKKK